MGAQSPFPTSLNASLSVCKAGILKPITADSMIIRDNEHAMKQAFDSSYYFSGPLASSLHFLICPP